MPPGPPDEQGLTVPATATLPPQARFGHAVPARSANWPAPTAAAATAVEKQSSPAAAALNPAPVWPFAVDNQPGALRRAERADIVIQTVLVELIDFVFDPA